jgi:hypothetical protein
LTSSAASMVGTQQATILPAESKDAFFRGDIAK